MRFLRKAEIITIKKKNIVLFPSCGFLTAKIKIMIRNKKKEVLLWFL